MSNEQPAATSSAFISKCDLTSPLVAERGRLMTSSGFVTSGTHVELGVEWGRVHLYKFEPYRFLEA